MKLKKLINKKKLNTWLAKLFSFNSIQDSILERNAAELIIILLEARSKKNLEVRVNQNDKTF